ncbi:class I SAM-dependent methyltransferase [Myroides sp. LJL110]
MKDLLGQAILDYQTNNSPEDIQTQTDISESEIMPIAYMFRDYHQMPKLEQKALQMAKGKVLDVGCAAGSHSLYLQKKNLEVHSIDISKNSIETCLLRGVNNPQCIDLLDLTNQKYDTILLLMNGTGIFGYLKNLSLYLKHLAGLLNPKGQILIDSCDLIYMFDTLEDGSVWVPMHDKDYYGELTFELQYKGQQETPFPWLYLDYNTLQNAAVANNFTCELIKQGNNYDYLARLSL